MNRNIIEKEIELSEFLKRNNLTEFILKYDEKVLLLPQNLYLNPEVRSGNQFPSSTKELKNYFLQHNLKSELFDDGQPKNALVLKSDDIILPLLVFLGTPVFNIGINLLSSWIYDRFINYKKVSELPNIELEFAQLDEKNKIHNWQKIKGNATEVCELLSKINANSNSESLTNSKVNHSAEVNKEPAWEKRFRENAKASRIVANELIREGNILFNEGLLQPSENILRKSLIKIREAYLWEPSEIEHRKYLHSIGKIIHDRFQCVVTFEEGQYWRDCPVELSHTKGGFSIGGVGKKLCSICGKNELDCEHNPGDYYDSVEAIKICDICNICGKDECEHIIGNKYNNVQSFKIVTEYKVDHIAYVEKPANPLCVTHKISVTKSDVEKELSPEEFKKFEYGKTVLYCHHCLECNGS